MIKLNDPKAVTSHYHRNKLYFQNKDINQWCYKLGISRHKIESHPYVADIRLLLDLLTYEHEFNIKDKAIFDKVWSAVYINEYPLSQYYKLKLNTIVNGIEYRRERIQHIRNRRSKKKAAE